MDNNIFNEIGTTLDLNGPILSYSEQPTGATGIGTTINSTGGGSVSFTGIATGVDPGTGYISYEWYEQDVGKLSDSTYVTGTASTGPVGTAATLTISNLITPTDNQRKFYLVTDYVASAYGTAKSTGNAWNEPLTSGIATATVSPLIEIVAQPPEGVQTLINPTPNEYQDGMYASISVNADLTDSYFADDITYQWYLNGELAEDGVKTVTTTTGTTESGPVEETFTSQGEHTFPDVQIDSLEITVAGASGGGGGYDGGGPGGNGAYGRAGRFSMVPTQYLGKTIGVYAGYQGNDGSSGGRSAGGEQGVLIDDASGTGDGGHGGGAGNHGWSGGGGGGGAASYIADAGTIAIAAGGAGGGGGSHRIRGRNASATDVWIGSDLPTIISLQSNGNAGQTKTGDGGGGGGGGGGAPGGIGDYSGSDGSGRAGQDKRYASSAGTPGESRYDRSMVEGLLSQWENNGNGYVNIKYTGYTSTEVTTVKKTTISGSLTNTLKLASDTVGIQTAQCKITSATATNSPVWTDTVNFVATTTADEYLIISEGIGIGVTASLSSINLANGDHEFTTSQSEVSSGGITKYYSIYSPDKDIDIVEMDLYGGKGDDKGSYTGGEGGYSRIRFSMAQNQEYVIVGLSTDSVNTPFLYRKGVLIACVGQGGAAGKAGNGGAGGGVLNAGQDGRGMNSGKGGDIVPRGNLDADGVFGSLYPSSLIYPGDSQAGDTSGSKYDGGRTIRCTKGVFWAQNGAAACADMGGTTQFRLPDGTVVENSADIVRGFKAGYNIMETAGAQDGNGGVGGNGATGGQGASEGGGGGGSGYQDGSITVVDTQQGGSTGNAKVILRIITS